MTDRIARGVVDVVTRRAVTYSTAWRVERRDGVIIAVCNHSSDVTLPDGYKYRAAFGGATSAVRREEGMGNSDVEVQSIVNSAFISYTDLQQGKYDDATVIVSIFDADRPYAGILESRRYLLRPSSYGELGWKATLVGLHETTRTEVGQTLSPTCVHILGAGYDTGNPYMCTVNLARHPATVYGTVVSPASIPGEFTAARADGYFGRAYVIVDGSTLNDADGNVLTTVVSDFANGTLYFMDGANAGASGYIREHGDPGEPGTYTTLGGGDFAVKLLNPMRAPIAGGERVQLRLGCNKRLGNTSSDGHCYNRFQNTHQFKGDPIIPGTAPALKVSAVN